MTNKEWLIEKIKTASEDELAEFFERAEDSYNPWDKCTDTYYVNIFTDERHFFSADALKSIKNWLKEEHK